MYFVWRSFTLLFMPRVSRAQSKEHHHQVLDIAARVFRERGFDGISVAELMAAAGLTHGGFYGHFSSKEALMAQAFERAGEQSRARWREIVGEGGDPKRSRRKLVDFYLSKGHRDQPGGGCPVAALAGDVSRHPDGDEVRSAYGAAVRRWAEMLTTLQPIEAGTQPKRRKQALLEMAALVGAVLLARATRDDAISEEILSAVRDQLLA